MASLFDGIKVADLIKGLQLFQILDVCIKDYLDHLADHIRVIVTKILINGLLTYELIHVGKNLGLNWQKSILMMTSQIKQHFPDWRILLHEFYFSARHRFTMCNFAGNFSNVNHDQEQENFPHRLCLIHVDHALDRLRHL
jgi:hypothetical protein